MKMCLLPSDFLTIIVCMCTVGVLGFPSSSPSPSPSPTASSTVCPTQPSVDCEECLTDCCEELLIAIKTWEDCNCTPVNGTQADDENYLYRRIYYKQLFIWLREYCEDHNAHVHFHH